MKSANAKWTYVNKWYLILPLLFLVGLFLLPIGKLFYISFFESAGPGEISKTITLNSYIRFLSDPFYLKILYNSLALGLLSTLICIILGYPVAYRIARLTGRKKSIFTALVVLPLWVSITIRMYGWMAVLTKSGFINNLLLKLHIISEPIPLMGTYAGVLAGLVHCGLPFMIMTLIGSIENVDTNYEDASYVFGAGFLKTFFKITLPLTLPGIISGSLLVFALNTAAFVVPVMLGGGKILVMTTLIYQQALFVYDWPFASAISVILLITSMIIVLISNKIGGSGKLNVY